MLHVLLVLRWNREHSTISSPKTIVGETGCTHCTRHRNPESQREERPSQLHATIRGTRGKQELPALYYWWDGETRGSGTRRAENMVYCTRRRINKVTQRFSFDKTIARSMVTFDQFWPLDMLQRTYLWNRWRYKCSINPNDKDVVSPVFQNRTRHSGYMERCDWQ